MSTASSGHIKKVALLVHSNSQFYKEVSSYIVKRLRDEVPNVFIQLMSSGGTSPIAVHSIIDSLIKDDYDLIVTFNSPTAVVAKNRIEKSGKFIPFLFINTAHPIEYGLISSYEKPGGLCTGVSHVIQDIPSYCDFFIECFPKKKKVMLLFEGGDLSFISNFITEDMIARTKPFHALFPEMKRYFEQKGVQCDVISGQDEPEILSKVSLHIQSYDAVLLMEGSRFANWSKGIGKKCIENKVVFYSGALTPIMLGHSPIGYALDHTKTCQIIVDQAKEILLNGKNPGDIPAIRLTTERYACVNIETMKHLEIGLKHVYTVIRRWNGIIYDG